MNKKNISQIIEHYIEKNGFFGSGSDGKKNQWQKLQEFQNVFDMDAPDFADMLKKACEAADDLVDGLRKPFKGLVFMASRDGEAETIREMFRRLYREDNGDLLKRQARIREFIETANDLLEKHHPGSIIYKNDQSSAMAYLWMADPEHNYPCRRVEAMCMAYTIGFSEDWGDYDDFNLPVYYDFCDTVISDLLKEPDLMDAYNAFREEVKDTGYRDEKLHILVYDFMHSARVFDLYNGVKIRNHSVKDRKVYEETKSKADKLLEQLSEAEHRVVLLKEAKEKAVKMIHSGATITHKTFGKGVVKEADDHYVTMEFPERGTEKKFQIASALGGGFIRVDLPEFEEFISENAAVLKSAAGIPRVFESAEKAMEPYWDYVD